MLPVQFNCKFTHPVILKIVVFDDYKNSTILVTDINGKLVLQQNMNNRSEAYIPFDYFIEGTYNISVLEQSKIITTKKIIKTH